MKDCPYCRVVQDPAGFEIVESTELVVAFLHPAPACPGQTLIIPRRHRMGLSHLSEAESQAIFASTARLGKAMLRSGLWDGYNLLHSHGSCAGAECMHMAWHLIPRLGTDGFALGSRSLKIPQVELAALAALLRERLALAADADDEEEEEEAALDTDADDESP